MGSPDPFFRPDFLHFSLAFECFSRCSTLLAAPWQFPQCVYREDDGERRGHAQREQRPYEEQGLRDLPIAPPRRPLAPFMWTRRTTRPRSDPKRMMMYPARRSASTSVPYSQMTKTRTAIRFANRGDAIPKRISPAM